MKDEAREERIDMEIVVDAYGSRSLLAYNIETSRRVLFGTTA